MALGKGSQAGRKMSDTIKRLDGLRKDVTKPVTFRLDHHIAEQLEAYAEQQGMRTGTLIKSWIIQKMRSENIIS